MQACSLIALHAMVKGLAAPTSAILNIHSVTTALLVIATQQKIPDIFQVIGMAFILTGVTIIILLK